MAKAKTKHVGAAILHKKPVVKRKKPKGETMLPLGIMLAFICFYCINYIRSLNSEMALTTQPKFKTFGRNFNFNKMKDLHILLTPSAHSTMTKLTMDNKTFVTTQSHLPVVGKFEDVANFEKNHLQSSRIKHKPKRPKVANLITSIGEPVTHRKGGNPIGAWMKDPMRTKSPVYVFENYVKNNEIYAYSDVTNTTIMSTYMLPYYWGGTGHVVMDGNLYFNKYNSRTIVKFNFESGDVIAEREIPRAGFANQSPYQWAGSSDLDLAFDQGRLFAVYATEENDWNITIGEMDPKTLQITSTWNTSYVKSWSGNTFMSRGVLYSLKRYDAFHTSLHYGFAIATNTVIRPNLPITIEHEFLTMLDYNEMEQRLYGWDRGYLVTYDVTIT